MSVLLPCETLPADFIYIKRLDVTAAEARLNAELMEPTGLIQVRKKKKLTGTLTSDFALNYIMISTGNIKHSAPELLTFFFL